MLTSSSFVDALIQYGILGLQQGYFKAAVKSFTHALQHDPNSLYAIANRAIAYAYQGEIAAALNDCSRALEFTPNHIVLHFNRAILHSQLGDIKAAISDFRQSSHPDAHPFVRFSHQSMIILYPTLCLERVVEAAGCSQLHFLFDSLSYLPLCSPSFNLPISIARSGLYQRWMKFYSAICHQYDSLNHNSNVLLEECLNQVLQTYTDEITHESNNVLLYWDRSWLYGELRAFEQAIDDLTLAITLAPTNAILWSNRGVMHAQLGDFNRALLDFNQSIALNSKIASVFINRAYALFGAHCIDEALRDLTRANQLFGFQLT